MRSMIPSLSSISCVSLAACALLGCTVEPQSELELPAELPAEEQDEQGEQDEQADGGERLERVRRAVNRLQEREPSVVATWSSAQPRVQFLSGPLHGPDPRPATQIAREMVVEYSEVFSIDDPRNIETREAEVSPRSGHTHAHYRQVLAGYPVLRRGLSVHVAPDGSVAAINGEIEPDLDPSALASVETSVKDVEWQVRAAYGITGDFEVFTDPQLVVSLDSGEPVLVWSLTVFAEGLVSSLDLQVDAHSGQIVREQIIDHHIAATGCDPFGNQVTINTTKPLGQPFMLHDKTRPGKIRGYDQQGSDLWSVADPHSDADNFWCDADQAGPVAGHSNMAKVLDHFDDRYGRNSYNGSGANIKMGFDAAFPNGFGGTTQSNASYNGGGIFKFGLDSYTVLDIVAHEFTHAVLVSEGVDIGTRQSAAVHESLADTFAVFVENDIGDENGTWNLDVGGIRDLGAPPASRDHFSEFVDASDQQHDNSRILSYAFALMVDGGVHPQSGVAVSAVSITDLRDIYYEAITQYLSPGNVTFLQVREAVVAAAGALHGSGSAQQMAARAAFVAVGITPSTFNFITWAEVFEVWNEWGNPVTFGAPQSSPGVGETSAKMEDGKLYDGQMMGFTPGGGALGHVAGEYQLTLPELVNVPPNVLAPHLQAEIGFPLIAVDSDEALVLLQLRDASDTVLIQSYVDVSRDDDTVDTVDWDLEAFAGMSVTLRVMVAHTGAVPTRPVMFDSLFVNLVWQ